MLWVKLAAGAILIPILLTSLGSIYPSRLLAFQMIKNQLKKLKINPSLFPVSELASFTTEMTKFAARAEGTWYRPRLRKRCESTAMIVAAIARGEPRDWSAAEIKAGIERGMPNPFWEILARHDPKRFGLDELEKTQMINAALLEQLYSSRRNYEVIPQSCK